jgi:hypothetical protein
MLHLSHSPGFGNFFFKWTPWSQDRDYGCPGQSSGSLELGGQWWQRRLCQGVLEESYGRGRVWWQCKVSAPVGLCFLLTVFRDPQPSSFSAVCFQAGSVTIPSSQCPAKNPRVTWCMAKSIYLLLAKEWLFFLWLSWLVTCCVNVNTEKARIRALNRSMVLLQKTLQTSENKTQAQVVGGKESLLCSVPAPGYLQNGTGPELRMVGVFISRKAAASKQRVQKQTWQLAVQGYNISCQHSCGRRPSAVSNQRAGCSGLDRGRALLIFDPFPGFDLSPGFLISYIRIQIHSI